MVFVGASLAEQRRSITYTQPTLVSAANGPEMLRADCAVCHRSDGRGGGPAAEALKRRRPILPDQAVRTAEPFPEPWS